MRICKLLCWSFFFLLLGMVFTQGSHFFKAETTSPIQFSESDFDDVSYFINYDYSKAVGLAETSSAKSLERNNFFNTKIFLLGKNLISYAFRAEMAGLSYLKFSKSILPGLPVYSIAYRHYLFS